MADIIPEVKIDWSTEPPALHSNYLYVQWNPMEAGLVFCDAMPFPGRAEGDNTISARVVASLRLTTIFFFHAALVIAGQWNKFAQAHALNNPGQRLPRFTLIDAPDVKIEGLEDIAP